MATMQIVLSVTVILVGLSVAIMHVTVSVAIMELEVSAVLLQVKVSALNMWVTIFIVFMQVGVSVAIKQVVLSAVHNCFCCSVRSFQAILSSNSFIFFFSKWHPLFIKLTGKYLKTFYQVCILTRLKL